MGKSQKDMSHFRYWRARERNSESTGVLNFIKVLRQKDICIGKSQKDMCPLTIGEKERQIQNQHVLSIFSQSGDNKSDL